MSSYDVMLNFIKRRNIKITTTLPFDSSFLLPFSLIYLLAYSPSPPVILIYHLQLESLTTHVRPIGRKGCHQGGCTLKQVLMWPRGYSSPMLEKNLLPKSTA